ncbi:hypothetical protein IW261DRAFT_1571959 [Armillaria novae-zelandiae]|uniref:Uncharacterized protein n=1 Tax=Armillaria novae-zelandiae TaxID=153914 RepID=A0AA39NTT0_9AGAR|nr:hypothetical protein IW261DRAFT_1571959 [Armillaria novae-zelandiae]
MPEQCAKVEVQKIHLVPMTDPQPDHLDNGNDSNWQDISDVFMLDAVLCGDKAMDISHEGGEYELANNLRDKLVNVGEICANVAIAPNSGLMLSIQSWSLWRMRTWSGSWSVMRIEEHICLVKPHCRMAMSGLLTYFDDTVYLSLIYLPRLSFTMVSFPVLPSDQMSVQGFMQTLICYDVYIAILDRVEHQIMKALGHEDVDWHLKNCCSACTFVLEGEEELEFSMFGAMDGNNSMKCVPCSKLVESLDGGRVSIEREDSWDGGRSYILSRSTVDLWSKESIGEVDAPPADKVTPCEECWKNMSDDRTLKMWNIFDETGFFLSLCRHGSVLVSADMVRSGEQAKYPLAVVSKLLEVFGEQLRLGYDIGCKFGGTVNWSPLGELARHKKLCVLLQHLGTYLTGLGLEDLETLERFFSKSNTLAGHIDCFESFEHLSSFLCNNYQQGLEIIETYPALHKSMCELGVNNEKEFDLWLKEEEVYLLVHYYDLEMKVAASQRVTFVTTTPRDQIRDDTRKMETARRRLLEKRSQELECLQDLEQSLNISPEERWTVGCAKWVENEQWVAMRMYHQRLDHLESLVVSRIFELTKMNMSHTDPRFTGDISVGSVAGVWEGFGLDIPEDVSMDAEDYHNDDAMATDGADHEIVDLGNNSQSNGGDNKDEEITIDEEVEAIMLISGDNAQE